MINEFKNIDGLILRESDGYLRISNDNLDNPIPLDDKSILKALSILRDNDLYNLSFGTPYDKLNNIAFLKDFAFLEGIEIGLEGYDINPLYECCELNEIRIQGSFAGTIDFSQFPKLKKVFIDWENAGVETLFNCPQLESVSLVKYNGLSLSNFEALPNLKELVLYDPKVISLNGVGNLKYLEKLEIFNAKKLRDLGDIENVQTLRKLFLYGAKNVNDLTSIMYLKNLRVLNLDSIGKTSTIRFLETLKNLEECYLTESTNVVDGDLSVLANLRANHNLNKVIFTNRNHYSHTREQLGYQAPASVAAIFKKKK